MMIRINEVAMIIPCRNEADNIEGVIKSAENIGIKHIVVGLDPATDDSTEDTVIKCGGYVAHAGRSGYDSAVAAATKIASGLPAVKAFAYADAGNKYSLSHVQEMLTMMNEGQDLILAARTDSGKTMLWHQKLGTQLVLLPIGIYFRKHLRDITPFRMVRATVFDRLSMDPRMFRWPSEMLVKALALKLSIAEITIESMPRQGISKVSGSFRNSARAGYEMFSSLQFLTYKESK